MTRRCLPRFVRTLQVIPSDIPSSLPYAPVVLALCVALGVRPLGAQWRADAELGGAHVSQAEFPSRLAATASAMGRFDTPRWVVQGSTALTMPPAGEPRLHGLFMAGVQTSLDRRLGAEVAGVASVYDEGVFPRVVSGFGGARLRVRAGRYTLWGGAGAGALDDGAYAYPLVMLEAGAATMWRGARLTASAVRHGTLGEPRTEFVEDPPALVVVRDPVAYTDASLGVHSARARSELSLRAGTRVVHRTIANEARPRPRFIGSIDAAWWMTPRAAVVATAGRELADLTRGLPDSRYVTLGLRVRRYHPPARPSSSRTITGAPVAGSAPDVLVERGTSAGPLLRVLTSAGAQRVEVAGTFTGWQPVLLASDGNGAWVLPLAMAPGPHRLVVRVDGGEWQAPANLPSIDDELGARVGMVTVP